MSLKEVVERICEPNPRRLIMEDEIVFGSPITGEGIVAINQLANDVHGLYIIEKSKEKDE